MTKSFMLKIRRNCKPIIACGAFLGLAAALAAPAEAQSGRGYEDDGRCLSSNEVNAHLMLDGWYPEALVGTRDGGHVLIMRVSQGPRKFIAFVDGCSAEVLHMRGDG
jgi:hypothetical protein